ncbi:ParA family protein [Parvibaculum sp.]|jgi:chromosome partitioning protein|uniref:ParA family protein n=1 Tax=Parvibaculum sp. TaxID=2024848 RepID=UPI000C3DE5D4|nr:ParA family protein [Parvibaculum sp.]MAM94558.1 chromosome partitioning protein ParA [Parvibaculum sp.]|tara:strand:- start:16666 stop:17373 length:708 start_codon:yes stop_codon:yes gene_type:complete
MHVIAFASQKGGSGKTTLAGHIAVEAERQGAGPVALIDTDPQGSLSQWWNAREAERPFFVSASEDGLEADLARLKDGGVNLVIIDTPPAITSTIGHVIGQADLIVIPTRPSPHDLRAAGATVRLCEEVGKPLVFAVNGAAPRARITTEAVIALSHHGPVAPSILHQRIDFAASMIDGRTVMEISSSTKSPEEIAELWSFLNDRLKGRETSPLTSGSFVAGAASSGKAEGLLRGAA